MQVFLFILTNNLIPIFALILTGVFVGRKFDLQISTLSKMNLYVFMPAFVFVNVYSTQIPLDMMKVVAVASLILFMNALLGYLAGKFRGYESGLRNAFSNSIMFYNSGNFGVPLITLVFSSRSYIIDGATPYLDLAMTVQIVILVIQNIATNTVGVFNASYAAGNWKTALRKALNMPAIYFVAMAFILKAVPYDITKIPLWSSLVYAKNGLISVALLTLGIQLAQAKLRLNNPDVYISVFLRLIGGPCLAIIFILLFGLNGIIAQVLVISSSVPTAVNTVLIGVEFDNHPNFASQTVMISTILSAITLTGVIYLAGVLFPVV